MSVNCLVGEGRDSALIPAFITSIKAAYSVTFDLFILELMFLFFKNTVK